MSTIPDGNSSVICAALIVLALLSLPLHSQASETVVLKVFLNTADKGDYFMRLTPDGDVLFRRKDLLEIGFKETPRDSVAWIEQEQYLSLKSLSPSVAFTIDEKASALRITADPTLLEKHVVNLAYEGPADVLYTHDTAAFLNYSLDYNAGDGFDYNALSIPVEAGLSLGGTLGFSSFAYTQTEGDDRFVRLFSSLTKDDRTTLRRTVLGDFSAFTGTLGSGGLFGGLSVSKNFNIRPDFRRFPGLDIAGVLETPSDVELYVNGLLVKKEHVPAGEFQFENLPGATTGAGDASLVIRDAFGREVRVENPFYLSTQLLKTGLHDYSYNAGFKRKAFGYKTFEYGDPAFLAFHRYGFTRSFTGGLRTEADPNLVNLGGSATFVPWRLGESNVAVSVSDEGGRYGYAGFLSYSHAGGGPISGSVSVSGGSREYTNLGISSSRDRPRFTGSISLGYNQRDFGSLSATYSATDFYSETDRRRASVYYSRKLWRNVSLQVRASRTEGDGSFDEVFAGLLVFLGGGRSGNLTYQVQDGKTAETVSLQQNPPLGPGLGYRFLIDHIEGGQGDSYLGGNASAQYRGPYGIYSTDYNRISGQDNYDIRASGGVALINNSAYLTRPISDGFALVKVGDLEGVQVQYSNQETGTTNENGEVIVPNLISYYDNDLSIEPRDIPVNYEIAKVREHVSPPVRGGSIVKFDITKLQGFTGRLYIMEQGKREAAQYWGLRIWVEGQPREFTVGKGGEFYFENLPSGQFRATLFSQDRTCDFHLIIPESDAMMVDLGEVTCALE